MTWTSLLGLVAPTLAVLAAVGNLYVGVQLRIRDRQDFERLRDEYESLEARVATLSERLVRLEVRAE